jgi:hypothetical protein
MDAQKKSPSRAPKQQPWRPLFFFSAQRRRSKRQQPRRLRATRCFVLRSEQHAVMPAGGLLFLRSPIVVVVHPGGTVVLLVRFRIDVVFMRLIVYVCCFILFLWRRGTRILHGEEGKPLDARRCS